jgi:hypothetical protein
MAAASGSTDALRLSRTAGVPLREPLQERRFCATES